MENVPEAKLLTHKSLCREATRSGGPGTLSWQTWVSTPNALVVWLQISGLRQMAGRNRHECTLTDGRSIVGGVTGQDVTAKIMAGEIKDGSIIEMTDYACNFINQEHKIVLTGAAHRARACPPIHTEPALAATCHMPFVSNQFGSSCVQGKNVWQICKTIQPVSKFASSGTVRLPAWLYCTAALTYRP